jgi:hypothetical protein
MRFFLLIAIVVCFVLALVCLLVPTAIVGVNWPVWLISGLLGWALDHLLEEVEITRA